MSRATETVLGLVREERKAQEARYAEINDQLESGTGPQVQWLRPYSPDWASFIQEVLRREYETFERENGQPTWMHLVREEIAEAFQEEDPERLAQELIQVAALCVSWVERLRVVACEECGNDDGPHTMEGRRLCSDCLERIYL